MRRVNFLFCLFMTHHCFGQGNTGVIPVNGTELFVSDQGKGNSIIVIHGGPGLNHSYFLPHLNALNASYRVVYFDQRACGLSSGNLDSAQMSLSHFVDDIESLRNRLGLGKVIVLAHSWGGLLGMLYASKYPEHVCALILSNTVSPATGEFETQTNQRLQSRTTKEDSIQRAAIVQSTAFRAGDPDAYAKLIMLSFKPSFYDTMNINKMQLHLPTDFKEKRRKLFYMSAELARYDFYSNLAQVKCPTLVIHADYDAIPVALSEKIVRMIPNAKMEVIQHAGHFPFIERTETYIEIVHRFISATVK